MNLKDRFNAIMDYKPFDRQPLWYFGEWESTAARWHTEGVPEETTFSDFFGMDHDWEQYMWDGLGVDYAIKPFEYRVLEDTPEYVTARFPDGVVRKSSRAGESISQDVEVFLKDRTTWDEFTRRQEDRIAGKDLYPSDWEQRVTRFKERDFVLCFMGGSLYGWLREWMTPVGISLLQYDDPVLLSEMVEYLAVHFMRVYERALKDLEFDFVYLFEDCCFSNGSLIAPAKFREIWMPHYRTLIDFYRSHGVRHVLLDSDGKVDDLVPLWLEAGVDILFPIEVGTWNGDVNRLRREYGRDLRMMGGVDKHVIGRGEKAIQTELKRVESLARDGGYIPLPDHRIPPDVSVRQMEEYCDYFRQLFC